MRSNNDIWTILSTMLIYTFLFLAIIFFINSCSASKWNNGLCPECEIRYELRGVSKGLKYYTCPKCGQEASRY